MSQTVPKDRVRIFDRQGMPLAEFRTNVARSWAIGYEGRASFVYPVRKTDVVNEKILQFGNYLLVESDSILSWVGVIDTPRKWNKDAVEVNAYTCERIFSYRRGGVEEKINGTAGEIFAFMVNKINAKEQTVLRLADLYHSQKREETFTPENINSNLKSLQERSQEDYYFLPRVISSKLVIYCYWVNLLGQNTPLILSAAAKGGNIESPSVAEDDDIINQIMGYGDGMSWNSRPYFVSADTASINKYGLRMKSINWNGVTQTTTLIDNNKELLAKKSNPRKVIQTQAINIGDTFKHIQLGNRMKISIQDYCFTGLETTVRIIGMSYNPKTKNKIKLVLEEILL